MTKPPRTRSARTHMPMPLAPPSNHGSTISLQDFGKAMSVLDLSNVPPPNRAAALMDHLAHIMASTVTDPTLASELRGSRIANANKKLL